MALEIAIIYSQIGLRRKIMGGSPKPTVIEAPAPPAAPSYAATLKEYNAAYPESIALQQKYAPELAQLEYQLQQQYSPLYAQLQKQINEQLYPQTASLQENLASQALQGMNQGLPEDLRQKYVSDFNAGLGMNVNSPIGVSDRNVALTQLNEQWKNYYQNLGLSAAGRQPLAQGQQQAFQDPNSGFQGALNFAQQSYGGQLQGYNSSLANRIIQPKQSGFDNILGAGAGITGLGLGLGPLGFGAFGGR